MDKERPEIPKGHVQTLLEPEDAKTYGMDPSYSLNHHLTVTRTPRNDCDHLGRREQSRASEVHP
jgi:hypothetical protein